MSQDDQPTTNSDSATTESEPLDLTTANMRLEWRDPRTLKPHPQNFRLHNNYQRTAFSEFLTDVGWVAPLMYNERTGRLIDGHMRRDEAIERNLESVPVVIVDLPPDKESEVLYFFDRIGGMAIADDKMEAMLAQQFSTEQEALERLLREDPEMQTDDDHHDIELIDEDLHHISLVPGEAFNYVVVLFKTEVDWVAAQEHFNVQRVEDPFRDDKTKLGIGRIIDGGAYLKRILG